LETVFARALDHLGVMNNATGGGGGKKGIN
jgi:hypothetical protein